jgi:hypothetical protein
MGRIDTVDLTVMVCGPSSQVDGLVVGWVVENDVMRATGNSTVLATTIVVGNPVLYIVRSTVTVSVMSSPITSRESLARWFNFQGNADVGCGDRKTAVRMADVNLIFWGFLETLQNVELQIWKLFLSRLLLYKRLSLGGVICNYDKMKPTERLLWFSIAPVQVIPR